MNELQIFEYEGMPVRNVTIGEECWWVLKDVANVLGIANHKNLSARLDEDEKGGLFDGHPWWQPTNDHYQ